jgi:general secretion pathway protein F
MSTISIEQLVALNDEIASLVRGGMPLELGLRELGHDSVGSLAQITQSLSARMQNGSSLAEALEAEQQRLPTTYRTVVTAGIRAGRLPAALEAISNYARELVELRRQISLALLYPLIVFALAYVLFLVFVSHVVDRFRDTYEVFRMPMPWILAVAGQATDWAIRWWWALPLFLLSLVLWWMATGGAQVLAFNGITQPLAWFPFVGWISRHYRRANFAELLALMVEQQVPLPEGLRLATEATGDSQLQQAGRDLADSIERGDAIASGRRHRYGLPPFLFWVLTCGQSGNELVRLLRHSAAIYRRKALNSSRWFRTLFPVAAAMIIGGGVTALYTATLFGPLVQFWADLGVE